MRRILVLLLALLALSSARADDLQWFTTLDAAKTEAQHTGRPIFFNCYVDWAGGSVLMDSVVLREPLMTERSGQRVFTHSPELAERSGAEGFHPQPRVGHTPLWRGGRAWLARCGGPFIPRVGAKLQK